MKQLSEYLLSIIAAAILCSILKCITGKSVYQKWMGLLFGLYMSIAMLRLFGEFTPTSLHTFSGAYIPKGEKIAQTGHEMAMNRTCDIIKETVEAYILSKAEEMGCTLQAEVCLNEDNIPKNVYLNGTVSPYVRNKLGNYIESDLGIAKENQIWSG